MRRMGFVCLAFGLGCQWHIYDSGGDSFPGNNPPDPIPGGDGGVHNESCDGQPINSEKELLVVDPSVIDDARAKNDSSSAPWSFRARLEEMAGDPSNAATLGAKWLGQFATVTSVGPYGAPVTPRPRVQSILIDPWQAACYGTLSASHVPFRLIAIVNRIDLRSDPAACVGDAGELRFVYTAVADGEPIDMTVIVEIPYPATRTPHEWAAKWHTLGKLPFGAEYNEALATLTMDVTQHADWREVHVRTNEIALGDKDALPWELREFALTDAPRALVQVPLDRTARYDLDKSSTLASWVKTGVPGQLLPESMRAGAAPIPSASFRWTVPNVSSEARTSFSNATCNGCHGGEHSALPFQHIAAKGGYYQSDRTRVSTFLTGELDRRKDSMENALCSQCDPGGTGGSDPYGTEPSHPSCPR